MGSSYAANATRRASPAWCKKGMWLTIPPLIAGRPVRLAAYVRWTQDYCATVVNMIESFQLSYNAGEKKWHGSSSDTGPNLALEIQTLAEPNHYDVVLILRNDLLVITDNVWNNLHIPDVRPFDTGLLRYVTLEDRWFYEVHARG